MNPISETGEALHFQLKEKEILVEDWLVTPTGRDSWLEHTGTEKRHLYRNLIDFPCIHLCPYLSSLEIKLVNSSEGKYEKTFSNLTLYC